MEDQNVGSYVGSYHDSLRNHFYEGDLKMES